MLDLLVQLDGGRTLWNSFMQVVEDDPKYWEVISSALAVGWLEVVVSSIYSSVHLFYYFFFFGISRSLSSQT